MTDIRHSRRDQMKDRVARGFVAVGAVLAGAIGSILILLAVGDPRGRPALHGSAVMIGLAMVCGAGLLVLLAGVRRPGRARPTVSTQRHSARQ